MAALDLSMKGAGDPAASSASSTEYVTQDLSYVFSLPPILHRIMSHLPMKELNSCGRVCRSWNSTAKQLKKKRNQLSWLLSYEKKKKGKKSDEIASETMAKIKDHFQVISSQPKVAFLFCTTDLFTRKINLDLDISNPPVKELTDLIVPFLPKDCLLFGTSTAGIIGTQSNNGSIMEIELMDGMSIFLLPKLEGIEIHHFLIRYPEEELIKEDFPYKQLGLLPTQKIKCFLLFCSESGPIDTHTYSSFWENQTGHFALGGGFVDYLIGPDMLSSEDNKEETILGIAICGENVEAVSVIIPADIIKPNEAEEQIRKLKNYKLSEENSFAFMFACVGRGRHLYKKKNVEADAFKKLFPKTPLFGFFGNGEIGIDTNFEESEDYTLDSKKEKNRRKSDLPEIYHSNTTIFCLVSIKK